MLESAKKEVFRQEGMLLQVSTARGWLMRMVRRCLLWNQRNSVGYAGFPVSFVGAGIRVLLSRGRLGAPPISVRIGEGIICSSVRVVLGLVESL